ncbi:MsnO8 family LLM class oxidoreductase [Naasia lichenicola]|uniref:MsnO8 family LLM class oxidoreductase n=1 Tax=Naasia lichenicola TaxID=2565933 RepID=UPI001E2EA04A|nr:MsnO8 family LLM class oxidoreductase [Naasia lichenicola]
MSARELKLSVLDLIPVRTGQRSADAVAATTALAIAADDAGYTRYWLAEHHNMASVASTNPPVLIGVLAARTTRIRVGSGGVMLPNHAPLVIAEQFAALEASAPGRIDLGIGRAPGSDPVISALLQSSGHTSDVDTFPNNVTDIIKLLSPDGAALSLRGGQTYPLRATPNADGVPTVWLLGSSDYSARLAAKLGLPYVFAHHFSGEGTAEALRLYRSQFQPSEDAAEPRTLLTANVVAAATAEEAHALALPQLQQMARLRTGERMDALPTVEEAAATTMTAAQDAMIDRMRGMWIIDEADAAARRLRELAEQFDVDEIMVSPGASAHAGDPIDRSPARESTVRLLAERLLAPALVG